METGSRNRNANANANPSRGSGFVPPNAQPQRPQNPADNNFGAQGMGGDADNGQRTLREDPNNHAAKYASQDQKKDFQTLLDMTLDGAMDAMLTEDFLGTWAQVLLLMRYSGFNPEMVFEALKGLAASAGITTRQMLEDIRDMISYGIQRGSSIVRRGRINASSPEAANRITALIARYKLVDNLPRFDRGDGVLTIPRILNSFPMIVAIVMAGEKTNIIGTKGLIPRALMSPSGAAMIPTLPSFDFLFELYVTWSVSFVKVINRLRRYYANTPFDEESARDEQSYWADLARTQSNVSDERRILFLSGDAITDFDMGITMKDNKFVGVDSKRYGKVEYKSEQV